MKNTEPEEARLGVKVLNIKNGLVINSNFIFTLYSWSTVKQWTPHKKYCLDGKISRKIHTTFVALRKDKKIKKKLH